MKSSEYFSSWWWIQTSLEELFQWQHWIWVCQNSSWLLFFFFHVTFNNLIWRTCVIHACVKSATGNVLLTHCWLISHNCCFFILIIIKSLSYTVLFSPSSSLILHYYYHTLQYFHHHHHYYYIITIIHFTIFTIIIITITLVLSALSLHFHWPTNICNLKYTKTIQTKNKNILTCLWWAQRHQSTDIFPAEQCHSDQSRQSDQLIQMLPTKRRLQNTVCLHTSYIQHTRQGLWYHSNTSWLQQHLMWCTDGTLVPLWLTQVDYKNT